MRADELKHFEETFRRYGFSDNDFSIAGKMDKALYVKEKEATYLDEEVTVICHKSGKSKTYRCGHDTDWVAEFEQDLLNKDFSLKKSKDVVDEVGEDSFPASDPGSWTLGTDKDEKEDKK